MSEMLANKAQGLVLGLKDMPPQEREKRPSGAFADDYNQLRELVVKTYPEFESFLPPKAETTTRSDGVREAAHGFREFQGWATQIYILVNSRNQRESPTMF